MQSYSFVILFFLVQLLLDVLSILIMEEFNYLQVHTIKSIPPQEISALQDLYLSTKGNKWYWRDKLYGIAWNFTVNCNPCEERWQGVTCSTIQNKSQHVVGISLEYYNLNGTLPTSLMNITKLEQLIVSNNHLYGKLVTYAIHTYLFALKFTL